LFFDDCEESEATMAAEREDIMRLMNGGAGDEGGIACGHQLN